mgnify:CR=1 FL=1
MRTTPRHFARTALGASILALTLAVGPALADSIYWLIAGRALQGAGAISAAVTALLADLTRDEVRTKGMALVGVSIGLTFAASLMLAPPLAGWVGLSGLFTLTVLLSLGAIVVVLLWTPPEPAKHADAPKGRLADVWLHPALWRLNLGVFVLHTVQMSMWIIVPGLLVAAGLPKAHHWTVYLPAVLASFVLLGGLFAAERHGHLLAVWRGSIALLAVVQLLFLLLAPRAPGIWGVGWVLLAFFVAFNILEASQPSLVSQLAPAHARGAALGVYNTMQSVGLFAGGALGGWLFKLGDAPAVLIGTSLLAALWLLLGWAQVVPLPGQKPASASTPSS